ncbi:MAG: hypothetical protein AAF531_22070 [Actinomycetota bacterium]
MSGRRGRKVHVVEIDGVSHNAYATSLMFSLTLDDLAHAIALAATADPGETSAPCRFSGTVSYNPVARESYWTEQDLAEAAAVAAALGPGGIYTAARAALYRNGSSWRLDRWDELFPPEVARRRADELFPMLRREGNPFAPGPVVDD